MKDLHEIQGENGLYIIEKVMIYKEIESFSTFYKITDCNGRIKIIGDCDNGKQKRKI